MTQNGKIDINELEKVTGGANKIKSNGAVNAQEAAKFALFEAAWDAGGFEADGHTRHEMEQLFEKWKGNNYIPEPADFLSKY